MADVLAKTRIEVQADTSAATRAMASLKTSIDGMGTRLRETFRDWESFSRAASSAFSAMRTGMEATQRVFQIARTGMDLAKFAGEMRHLERSVPTDAIYKMQVATTGAVSRMDLMRFATKALRGEMALSVPQLEMVMQAADNLGDQGFGDTMEIADKLMHSLRTGMIRGLGDLGIKIGETGDKQANINALLAEFQEIAQRPINVDPQLEAIERLQAETQNWIDEMKAGLGEVFSWFVRKADEASTYLVGIKGRGENIRSEARAGAMNEMRRRHGVKWGNLDTAPAVMRDNPFYTEQFEHARDTDPEYRALVEQNEATLRRRYAGNDESKETDARIKSIMDRQAAIIAAEQARWKQRSGDARARERDLDRGGGGRGRDDDSPAWGATTAGEDAGELGKGLGRWAGSEAGRVASAFGSMFTPTPRYGQVGDAEERAKQATKTVKELTAAQEDAIRITQSVTTGVLDAIISGEDNVLKAAKRRLAGEMRGEALKYGAKAIAAAGDALFTGNPAAGLAALKYAAAAAAFASGAAALGVGDAGAGGGGAGASAGGGAGGGYVSGGGGRVGGDTVTTTINIGYGFGVDRQRAGEEIDKAHRAAKRSGKARSERTVIFE